MTAGSLNDFYEGSASVAGALIGLLFVAVSVSKDAAGGGRSSVQSIRAAASLTAFTNALAVGMFALIEGPSDGVPLVVVSIFGLCFVAASLISLRRRPQAVRDVLFLVTMLIALVAELVTGLNLIADATLGHQRAAAAVVVALFLIGIARAWELIDGPSIGIGTEVLKVAREIANPSLAERPKEKSR